MDIVFTDASVSLDGRRIVAPLTLRLAERRIGVIGLNGSGKTTFARMINGLTKPDTGTVSINGLDTVGHAQAVLSAVGFIFQNPQNQIILPIVEEDIAFGLKNRGLAAAEVALRTRAVLDRLDIAPLARRRVHTLSGGETQLVAIASIVVTEPDILVLDEPTNQLDLKNRNRIAATIAALEQPAIVVTHDLPLIEGFDRALLFHEGRLLADGAPSRIIETYHEVASC